MMIPNPEAHRSGEELFTTYGSRPREVRARGAGMERLGSRTSGFRVLGRGPQGFRP